LNSPVSSLLVGDRLVSRCDDGRLEAEFALFDRSEVLLSPGFREEGYMTTAGFARARLYEGLVTADLAYEAFAAMRGRHMRPLARSHAVRGIIDQLGPYETFQGGRFVAGRGRFAGVWLDLDALSAACPLRDAAILFQALHLILVLEEVADDAPVRLLTSQTGGEVPSGGRTWRRIDLEAAQRLPWVLREMQAPSLTPATAHDEAEVREEILRDLRARASATAVAQPRLAALAAAIARTGSTPPPGMPASDAVPSTQRMSSRPAPRPSSSRPPPGTAAAPASRAPAALQPPPANPAPEGASADPAHLRNVARSLGALVERPPFMPDLAIGAARAWLAAGEPGFARHFARLVVDDASAPDDLRIQALEILDTTPKTSQTARPPPMESIRPAPVIVLSQPPAPPPAQPVVGEVASTAIVLQPPSMRGPPMMLAARALESESSPQGAPFEDRRVLDPRLVLLAEPDSQRSASFRLLRDNLLAKGAPRIIAVSSGSMHEGKTTCAINLALALSEKPATRVLLLDGNFFAPSLGEIFHIDATTPADPELNHPSLAPYRIVPLMRDFHVAALVQQRGDPPPVFNSRWFDLVINHVSGAGYDYIVIDAAALDGAPAVTQLLGVADGTLLTVRSHATTARSLRNAAEQIPKGRALGVTLMDGEA
jgi:Mrp family chromosome partitioning ATPase